MIRDFKNSLNDKNFWSYPITEDKTYLALSCPMMLISIIEFALIIITFVYCCQTICLRNQITGNNLKGATAVLYSQNPDINLVFPNQPNNFGISNVAFSGIEKNSCSENGKFMLDI